MNAGAWNCGMVVDSIQDIPTVKELIDRIMADAERLSRDRPSDFSITLSEQCPRRAR
jgi:NADH:quinone reductase (non-electrogenic)